jgi:regulatory protein
MNEEEKVREKISKFLNYRMRTKEEVKEKLKKMDTPKEVRERLIAQLEEEGIIDDKKFATLWIETRGEKYGKFRLKEELKRKGVKEEIINPLINSIKEEEVAKKLVKKWRRKKNFNSKDKKKLMMFLMRRGISWEVVKNILRGK